MWPFMMWDFVITQLGQVNSSDAILEALRHFYPPGLGSRMYFGSSIFRMSGDVKLNHSVLHPSFFIVFRVLLAFEELRQFMLKWLVVFSQSLLDPDTNPFLKARAGVPERSVRSGMLSNAVQAETRHWQCVDHETSVGILQTSFACLFFLFLLFLFFLVTPVGRAFSHLPFWQGHRGRVQKM